jgi:23S rRNA (pseudouridine1915-N3)-methyltransferase
MLLPMTLFLTHIGVRYTAKDSFETLTQLYLARTAQFARCSTEAFRSEESFFDWVGRMQGRTNPVLVLLDSRGRQFGSSDFAKWIGARRDAGTQQMVFAVGPADGWSESASKRATLLLSLGSMTMAHALARLVIAEQLYRAFTILNGHPYHTGH